MSLSQKVKAEYKDSINDVIEFEEKNKLSITYNRRITFILNEQIF